MRTFLVRALLLLVICVTGCLGAGGWTDKEAEVYFVVDGTTSMWKHQFKMQLDLVADVVSDMDIGHDRTRVGLGVFSDIFYPVIPVNNDFDKQELISEIRKAPHIKGSTYISLGLQGMRQELAPSMTRPAVPRIGVFFTDGKATFITHTFNNATRAKNDGIFMFAIGIGNVVEDRELVDISSDPKRDFQYRVEDFRSLASIRQQLSTNMAKVSLYQNDRGTCGKNTKVDTVFVYDEFDLGFTLRTAVETFLGNVADELRINPGNARIGVVSHSYPAQGNNIELGDFITREEFKQAVGRDRSRPGIDALLREAREKYFNTEVGHRTDAKKRVVLVMTHKRDNYTRQKLLEQLFRARFVDSIEVFIIRHGSDYDKNFLFQVASSPDHVLFTNLENATEPFLKLFCKDI